MGKFLGLAAIVAAGALGFAQPAAAQAAAAKPCVTGPWTVFFNYDSDKLSPQATAILDNAAAAYRACAQASVVVSGHTDRKGAADYNVGLSQRMAANVRSYLAGRGVPGGMITTEAFGETRPMIDTADGVSEPRNRRVDIYFGPGSGW